MRKKARVQDKLEKLSVADALHAIDFAEVVVLLIDATRGLELQDLKIADNALQEGRALMIALNKWDVAENASSLFNGVKAALEEGLSQAKGVTVLTISGATGKGLDVLMKAAFETREAWSRRVSTGQLNRWFERALEANPPPAPGGKRIKLRYLTQSPHAPADVHPVRHPRRSAARQLSALHRQRYPARSRLRCGAGPHERPRAEEPVREVSESVDARGLRCPWPVLRLAKAMRESRDVLSSPMIPPHPLK
jgi:Fe2+ transport system protein B